MFKINNEDAGTILLPPSSAFTVRFEHIAGWEDNTI